MCKIIFSFLALILSSLVVAQETFPTNGVKNTFEPVHAFTNAQIIWAPGQTLSNANLLVQGDRILAVDSITTIPTHAIIHDMDGDYIYPSFIELYSEYGIPHKEKVKWKPQPQYQSSKSGAVSWNEAIHPEVEAHNLFKHNEKSANSYRKAGFGTVLTHQQDGIARGSGLLTTLGIDSEHTTVLNGNASAHYSFIKGSSRQKYPSSLMGSIALLNQTYLDAEWYEQAPKGEYNRSLEAWNELQDLPQFFEVDNKIDILRAWKIADEFEIDYIFFGAGDEYQRVDEIAETGFALVIPLDFPDAYDVSNPYAAEMVSLQKMKDWEMAPANARILAEEDIFFAFTSRNLKKNTDLLANIKTAIAHGLSQEDALAALTTNPAEMIEASADLGTLEQGKIANFLICSGNLFEEGEIYSNWIQGKEHIINRKNNFDARGKYLINKKDTLIINGSLAKHKGKIIQDSTAIKVKLKQEGQHFTLEYETEGVHRISATYINRTLDGKLNLPNGEWTNWSASFLSKEEKLSLIHI